MSEQIRREFVLKYPLEKVKTAIEDACKTSSGSYQIKNRNSAFNSYGISLVKMLSVLPITIELRQLTDIETGVDLSAIAGPQLSKSPNFVSDLMDGFLNKVGDFLSGKLVVQHIPLSSKEPNPSTWKAAAILWIIVASLIAGLYFLMR